MNLCIELESHGQDIIEKVNFDITTGKIELYMYNKLKDLQVHKIFEHNVTKTSHSKNGPRTLKTQ